jgi:hypothetical protein
VVWNVVLGRGQVSSGSTDALPPKPIGAGESNGAKQETMWLYTSSVEIIAIEGESYRRREAELTQKKRRA